MYVDRAQVTPRGDRNYKRHPCLDHGTVSVTVERQGMREPTESATCAVATRREKTKNVDLNMTVSAAFQLGG